MRDDFALSKLTSAHVAATAAVLYRKQGTTAIVSLNRPRQRNAYNLDMRDTLFEILGAIHVDPEVRVVIFRGNGPAFGSGGDLNEFGISPSPLTTRAARWRRDVWSRLRGLPQLTIAAVHGYVVGGAFEMALLCDQCIAADNSRFALPETGLGMIPGVGGTQTASRLLGSGSALDLVLTGRELDAHEALRLGFVSRVVEPRRLLPTALAVARQAQALPPALVTRLKRLVHDGLDLPLPAALDLERRRAQGGSV